MIKKGTVTDKSPSKHFALMTNGPQTNSSSREANLCAAIFSLKGDAPVMNISRVSATVRNKIPLHSMAIFLEIIHFLDSGALCQLNYW